MSTFSPALVASLTGLISGLLLSIPVGPVNLTIINEGARRGFRWATLIGLGATVMEVTYCSLAFTGFASFFSHGTVKAAMELFSFAFMLYLGLKFVQVRTIPGTTRIEERVEEKLHPHSAFMVGFVRVLGNPGVFVFWIILAANFLSRGWVHPNWPGKMACIAGVASGCTVWFLTLSYAVSLGHRKLSERTLLRMEHLSGICLLVLALVHGINILYQNSRYKHAPSEKPGLLRMISRAPFLSSNVPLCQSMVLRPSSRPTPIYAKHTVVVGHMTLGIGATHDRLQQKPDLGRVRPGDEALGQLRVGSSSGEFDRIMPAQRLSCTVQLAKD
jgi:threonine/homoserine/homoserine lactone efflux protein